MSSKTLFRPTSNAAPADTTNAAGGDAYSFDAKHALAQYACTGTFSQTFYASDKEQLDKVRGLCLKVDPEFVAKLALYSREHGRMKDMPAFLVAFLAATNVKTCERVFSRVINNGKMLRNFVQILRSGTVVRKSLGTAPKRMVQNWFASRDLNTIFRNSIGADPSLGDVIKLSRPNPKLDTETGAQREALYRYLIGKHVEDASKLPPPVQAFEAFKNGGEIPDVPFEMLTSVPLTTDQWKQIAGRMSWTQLRMNLNTLQRHGVLADKSTVTAVAAKLADPELVRRSGVFPYQLMMSYVATNTSGSMPREITLALQKAMEVAVENVPEVSGTVYICPDVSGSMHQPVTGTRGSATSKVRCIDVAALVAAAFMRRNQLAKIIPFSDDIANVHLNPLDSIMTNAQLLARLPSGGTNCSAPLFRLNEQNAKGDLVVYVSDNMSWIQFAAQQGFVQLGTQLVNVNGVLRYVQQRPATAMSVEWDRFKRRNINAKLVMIDINPGETTQVKDKKDVLNIGGFSDSVFEVIGKFAAGQLGGNHWVDLIESQVL